MKILILNGSPRRKGTVATLLKSIANGIDEKQTAEWIDLYDQKMRPCIACMKCRPDEECVLSEDDAHIIGRKIRNAGGLIVGDPHSLGKYERSAQAFIRPQRACVYG